MSDLILLALAGLGCYFLWSKLPEGFRSGVKKFFQELWNEYFGKTTQIYPIQWGDDFFDDLTAALKSLKPSLVLLGGGKATEDVVEVNYHYSGDLPDSKVIEVIGRKWAARQLGLNPIEIHAAVDDQKKKFYLLVSLNDSGANQIRDWKNKKKKQLLDALKNENKELLE